MPDYDLLIRGGRLIDPAQGIDEHQDVAFRHGRVSALGRGLPDGEARDVLDAAGCLVVPGLIDLHTHVYWGATALGIEADEAASRSGATTVVDAGSAGAGNFEGFQRFVVERSRVRVLAYLNIAFSGISALGETVRVGEAGDERLLAVGACVATARRFSRSIRGIKVRLGQHGSGARGIAPLRVALEAAREVDLPVMAHIDLPPPRIREVVALLRPGDVLTHVFRPLSGESWQDVAAAMKQTRACGIVTDLGHGQGSFSFEVARALLGEGLAPDVISSDLHRFNADGPVHNLHVTMAKLQALGLGLVDVIERVTARPARVLGRPDLGTLRPGSVGDATVLAIRTGEFRLEDCVGEEIMTREWLVLRETILGGER